MSKSQNAIIYPSQISGTVVAPSSKSAAHRALICAILSDGKSVISNIGSNDDILASISVAQALGAKCTLKDNTVIVDGISTTDTSEIADCHCVESGSTLRFFTPIASALGRDASFSGVGLLPTRPMQPLLNTMTDNGVTVGKAEGKMFTVSGKLKAGKYEIVGNISSQYISGLLLALPLLDGNSEIHITTELESARYIDMTIQMMQKFGVSVDKTDYGYYVLGSQKYKAHDITVEGDYSGAAFWLSAAAIGFDVTVAGLDSDSLQADKKILCVLKDFGASVNYLKDGAIKVTAEELIGTDINATEIPDSIPVLAVVAAYAKGTTEVHNAERLRIKESDRLESTTAGLKNMGVDIKETQDGLIINGNTPLTGGTVSSYDDHRIAMAMAIAALGATKPVKILGINCVEKSYPDFLKDLKSLGGVFDVINLG